MNAQKNQNDEDRGWAPFGQAFPSLQQIAWRRAVPARALLVGPSVFCGRRV